MTEALPYFPPFDLSDRDTVGFRWRKWVRRFEQLMVGLTITDAARKKSLICYTMQMRKLMISVTH